MGSIQERPESSSLVIEPRFYAPTLDATRSSCDSTAMKAVTWRACSGSAPARDVRVFDGRGVEVRATSPASTSRARRRASSSRWRPRPSRCVAITVVQAVLKGDGMDAVVRDATMMGVAAIQPVLTARTVVTTKAMGPDGASAIARWRPRGRVVGEAVRPRARSRLRAAAAVQRGSCASPATSRRLMLVEPAASRNGAPGRARLGDAAESHACWSDPKADGRPPKSTEAIAAGWTPWSLGALTLRADAAAVVALGALLTTHGRPTG